MSKFMKYVAGGMMCLGLLGSMSDPAKADQIKSETKEQPAVEKSVEQIDQESPVYLQHNLSDYTLTLEGKDASGGKLAPVHWNHWSHSNHYSHSNHGSHWNSW
ncbi:MAG: hypothetical protein LWY06_17115 [Firmicutes bacterium]|nr:hypothetical protein [Bacillota bacterium]